MKSRPRHPEYIYVNEAMLNFAEERFGIRLECVPRFGKYPNIAVPMSEYVRLLKASSKSLKDYDEDE